MDDILATELPPRIIIGLMRVALRHLVDLCKVRLNVHEPSDYNESLNAPAFFGNQLRLNDVQHLRRFLGPWM